MADILDRLKVALADGYRIERELGSGGMATVYLAQDLKHDRHVALKVMRPELSAILGGERFLREIRIAAKLNHPHILTLHDSGEADGFLYYVMPHVEGESLRSKIEREKQLSIDEAVTLTRQVASALDYAHQQGVIHRDVKPENILLHRGEAVVADFGIALAVTAAGGERLTETGLSLGTPQYMSPEQATGGRDVDNRSDIYSLGAVLYEMVTGEPPQTGATVQAVIGKLLSERPTQPRVLRDSVPEAMDRAIMKALAKVPADRFDSAAEFATALTVEAAEPEDEKKSIVVLPFENLSPDPENEYFSDGLTEEIITDLSQIRSLGVISRNSAMQLKGTKKDTKTIGRELGVKYVLEGSVRRAAESLRITAQLIDATNDIHLWAKKYGGTLEDVFGIQEQVSASIVEALRLQLSPEEQHRLTQRPIEDLRAYECFLEARRDMWLLSGEALDRALARTERGLQLAGDNDALHAVKAFIYFQYVNTMSRPPETYGSLIEQAQQHASKALMLNPLSAQAQLAQGGVYHQSGNPKAAIKHMQNAVELDPNDAYAAGLLTFQLAACGCDLERARALAAAVSELDPLTPMNKHAIGYIHVFRGDFRAALEGWQAWQQQLEQAKSAFRLWFVWLHATAGNLDEALRLIDEIVRDLPQHVVATAALFLKHALLRERQETLDCVTEDLNQAARWDDLYSLLMAEGYALIGELDQAFPWLSHAIDYGFCNPYFLEHEPLIQNLRSDERFEASMERARRLSDSLLEPD
ncbi:MAG: protein kinase [Gemmatimonadota bacterium]|nr:MAG: protein kinase [Gemmatimonadota bacterium]